jgi:WD40 repeat protein
MIKIWNIKESKKNPVPIQIKSHLGAITSLAWLKNLKNIKADSEILFSASSSADIYLHQNKNGNFNEIAALKAQEGINSITIS